MKIPRRTFIGGGLAALATIGLRRKMNAQEQVPPNFVVIVQDDMDLDGLAVMTYLRSLPFGGWTVFDPGAVCNDAICGPSRASILTGQYSHHHGVVRNGRGEQLPQTETLPYLLSQAGYFCALFGKYLFGPEDAESDTPQGWAVFDTGGRADEVFGKGVQFLNNAGNRPFFLLLASTDPHRKAIAPIRYRNTPVELPPRNPAFNEADVSDKPPHIRALPLIRPGTAKNWDAERRNGLRSLMAVDDGIEAVMTSLSTSGLLDNTVVVFLSDNGFSYGEHRQYRKHNPYPQSTLVPLFIRLPWQDSDKHLGHVVSTVDIAPTLAEIAGIELPEADGISMVDLIEGQYIAWPNAALIEKHPDGTSDREYYGLYTDRWIYVEWTDGFTELYDRQADPYQLNNIAPLSEGTVYYLSVKLAGMKHE